MHRAPKTVEDLGAALANKEIDQECKGNIREGGVSMNMRSSPLDKVCILEQISGIVLKDVCRPGLEARCKASVKTGASARFHSDPTLTAPEEYASPGYRSASRPFRHIHGYGSMHAALACVPHQTTCNHASASKASPAQFHHSPFRAVYIYIVSGHTVLPSLMDWRSREGATSFAG
jgi:hypothetical protein